MASNNKNNIKIDYHTTEIQQHHNVIICPKGQVKMIVILFPNPSWDQTDPIKIIGKLLLIEDKVIVHFTKNSSFLS